MADLVIRADASPSLGGGHVMRCLALAERWTHGTVHFVGCYADPTLAERLASSGSVHLLHHVHPDPRDLAALQVILAQRPDACVALDGYHFTLDYHRAVRRLGRKLLVIDDTAHLPAYDADVILNPNPAASPAQYRAQGQTTFLLGPEFALLRREFTDSVLEPRPILRQAERLLLTFGAADPAGLTESVLAAWNDQARIWTDVRVVVGPLNARGDSIRRLLPRRARVVETTADLPALMRWADVAISAAGGTCWELAICGLPSVLVAGAANQFGMAEALAEAGAFVYAGRWPDVDGSDLLRMADLLGRDHDRRVELRRRAAALVDGKGAARVVRYIES